MKWIQHWYPVPRVTARDTQNDIKRVMQQDFLHLFIRKGIEILDNWAKAMYKNKEHRCCPSAERQKLQGGSITMNMGSDGCSHRIPSLNSEAALATNTGRMRNREARSHDHLWLCPPDESIRHRLNPMLTTRSRDTREIPLKSFGWKAREGVDDPMDLR